MRPESEIPYRATKAYARAVAEANKQRAKMRHKTASLWESTNCINASMSARSNCINRTRD